MAATAQTAHDKNGSQLFIGDEGLVRFKVLDVREGSVLTTLLEPPHRELWFHGSWIERTAQGKVSFEADRKAATASAPAAPAAETASPATEAAAPPTPREEAIAFVMSKGRTRDVAEKVVEEYGTRMILEDRDDEAREKKAEGAAGSQPGTDPSVPDANSGAAQNEAQKPTEGSGAA